MEFHVSRASRDFYRFDQTLFALNGNVLIANFHGARLFARAMNQARDLVRFPERAVKAGDINAMGLIDEILHLVVQLYREQKNPLVMEQAVDWVERSVGRGELDALLRLFTDQFPPLPVYRGEVTVEEYLAGESGGTPHRQVVLEELVMLWLANRNPAFSPFLELFDDEALEKETVYVRALDSLGEFFRTQPPFGPDNEPLLDMLQRPARAAPHSLSAQLELMRERWGSLLGEYLYRLLSSLDFIKEEGKQGFAGPGPARVYEYAGLELEAERFSRDLDWMPRVVMLAKNAYVWLDQLSKRYRRNLYRLDHIPDEELDLLARWGFNGLWLIGVWERSRASRTIKQLCGNPEAVASAYSLYEYRGAEDLGGEEAFQELKERAWRRGIRMGGDMVPNHMGIDSRWVMEHPDWFVSLDYSPFPSYRFGGPDLSPEEGVSIFLEEHYYDRTDAAVVFQRIDRRTGDTRYIYHGNDGTSMPWNDTAQLNFLNPEVREAVIQVILETARRFPIIRFDAAMTLTKKHYQRLWFPEPGSGGDIPSRAEHGMTRERFDQLMPREFWREVVDRVAREAPDTLLLAEAFWLLEGFFVRTLGMHRVYNSAFMNMLKNEDNAGYRSVIKNTLEFEPQVLKRFVNFMNNPDEETAVDQFGKGDKYIGVATLMVTMPGLPMFGHGQIEGFTEKYGMEYRRAYWDEQPDQQLIERHEREVFPLMRRRHLFAEVDEFLLYDFYTPEGHVNQDVFAYSNRRGDERTLVVYHNRYADTRGRIHRSAAYSVKSGDERSLVQRSLAEGLGLDTREDRYVVFRDHRSGLEYLRSARELGEQGLYVELGAYQCHVFLDFRQVRDEDGRYAALAAYLNGRGVPGVQEAMKEVFLQPLHRAWRELVNPGLLGGLLDLAAVARPGPEGRPATGTGARERAEVRDEAGQSSCGGAGGTAGEDARTTGEEELLERVEAALAAVFERMRELAGGAGEEPPAGEHRAVLAARVRAELECSLRVFRDGALPGLAELAEDEADGKIRGELLGLREFPGADRARWTALLCWLFFHAAGLTVGGGDHAQHARSLIDEWLLDRVTLPVLREVGLSEEEAQGALAAARIMTTHQRWFNLPREWSSAPAQVLESLLWDPEVQRFLGENRHQGILWFNAEAFELLLDWLRTV
ncbi:MAG: alpha-amylase family glycosyl hydrolase, partial [Spirochaetota bacterium]